MKSGSSWGKGLILGNRNATAAGASALAVGGAATEEIGHVL